jgi:hypothetical protein
MLMLDLVVERVGRVGLRRRRVAKGGQRWDLAWCDWLWLLADSRLLAPLLALAELALVATLCAAAACCLALVDLAAHLEPATSQTRERLARLRRRLAARRAARGRPGMRISHRQGCEKEGDRQSITWQCAAEPRRGPAERDWHGSGCQKNGCARSSLRICGSGRPNMW